MSAVPALQPDEFDFIAGFLKQRSGLALTSDKMYLLESRLQPIARSQGLSGIGDLVRNLRGNQLAPKVVTEIIESMTTNESSFYRDSKPFDHLVKIMIPRLKQSYPALSRLRVWSSACSTGQEPYSVAMAFKEESAKLAGMQCDILATDIADKVIERAKKGLYSQFEVQRGLPINLLLKYFKQLPDNQWEIAEVIRQTVRFQNVNLLGSFAGLGQFEIIFCRNVLIYFDDKTKTEVLEKMADLLVPGGFLCLGSAESVLGLAKKLTPQPEAPGLFVKA